MKRLCCFLLLLVPPGIFYTPHAAIFPKKTQAFYFWPVFLLSRFITSWGEWNHICCLSSNPMWWCGDFLFSVRSSLYFSVCDLVFDKFLWSFLKWIPQLFYPGWGTHRGQRGPKDRLFSLVGYPTAHLWIISNIRTQMSTSPMHTSNHTWSPKQNKWVTGELWVRIDPIPATSTFTRKFQPWICLTELNRTCITFSWNKGGFPPRSYSIINSDIQTISLKLE